MDGVKGIPGVQPYRGHKQNQERRKKRKADDERSESQSPDDKHLDQPKERAQNVIPNLIASGLPLFNELEGTSLEPALHEPVSNAVHHYQEIHAVPGAPARPAKPAEDETEEDFSSYRDNSTLSQEELLQQLEGLEARLDLSRPGDKSLSMLFEQMENAEEMAQQAVTDVNMKMLHLSMQKASSYLSEFAFHLRAMEDTSREYDVEHVYLDLLDLIQDRFLIKAHAVQSVGIKATLDAPDVFSLANPDPIEEMIARLPHIREGNQQD